jgi:predicted ester cyclase
MSSAVLAEENKTLARRFREDIWRDLSIAEEICDNEAVIHVNDPLTPELGKGPEGLKQLINMYLTAFPDANCVIDELVIEGDKVVARWTGGGTHEGNLGEIAPTGKQIKITGIEIHRIVEGKIRETWMNWDTLGMLKQLGVS